MSAYMPTASKLERNLSRAEVRRITLLVVVSVALSAVIQLFPPGYVGLTLLIGGVFPVATLKRPVYGFLMMIGATLFFEQYAFEWFPTYSQAVPFFETVSSSTSLGIVFLNPLEMSLMAIGLVYFGRNFSKQHRFIAGNKLLPVLGLLVLVLAAASIHGVLNEGSSNVIIWEIRALLYMVFVAVLLPNLVRTRRDFVSVLGVVTGVLLVKAFQVLWRYVYVVGGDLSNVETLAAHEDALFMGVLAIFLVAGHVLGVPRLKLPIVVGAVIWLGLAFILADRRIAYGAFFLALAFLLPFVPRERVKLVSGLALASVTAGLFYFGYFWDNPTGPFSKPVAAVRSGFASTVERESVEEDFSSDNYRRLENINVEATLKESPFYGLGFGTKYKMVVELPEAKFPFQDYIPHNEIWWFWIKAGSFGFWGFWMFMGASTVLACTVYRRIRDPLGRAVCVTVVILLLMQSVVSFADLQLTFFRNMVFLGTFLGLLVRVQSLFGGERLERTGPAAARV